MLTVKRHHQEGSTAGCWRVEWGQEVFLIIKRELLAYPDLGEDEGWVVVSLGAMQGWLNERQFPNICFPTRREAIKCLGDHLRDDGLL